MVSDCQQRFHILQVGGYTFGVRADAAIPGRAINLGNAWRLAQFPNQSMLAAATANDQNFHKRWRHKGRGNWKSVSNGGVRDPRATRMHYAGFTFSVACARSI